MSVAFKKQTLSKKEQDAKSRLYGKQIDSPPTKDAPIKQSKQTNPVPVPSNAQIDQFLNSMQQDFKQIAEKQVTMGMLNSQQDMIRQQNQILSRNQQQMQLVIDRQVGSTNGHDQSIQQLIQPIHEQLAEIKSMYRQVQHTQQTLLNTNANNNQQQPLQEYNQQSAQLKSMMEVAQTNLTYLQPENFQAIQNFTNFNLQLYQNTIANLQHQISALQNDQLTSEQELLVRYKQLNDAKMGHKLNRNRQVEEETLQYVHSKIESIDHSKQRQIVNEKLGGEFDYDALYDEVSTIVGQVSIQIQDFIDSGVVLYDDIPEYKLDEQDIQALSNKPTSILDELKAQLGINFKQPKPVVQQPLPPPPPIQPIRQEQDRKTIKPSHIQNIPTKPQEFPKDIKYEKQQTPNSYTPLISQQAPQPKVVAKPIVDKPVKTEKLQYRQQPVKQEEPPKQYGEIKYMQQDESFDDPAIEITYKPQQQKKQQPQQPQQYPQLTQQPAQQPYKREADINMDIVHPDPVREIKQAYEQQLLQDQYQPHAYNDPQFLNYDQLMNQIGNQEYGEYKSQEEKSGKILEILGLQTTNPKNQYELIEMLSRDILKEKLQQQPPKRQPKENVILKNQSVQIQPSQEPQSIQDQAQQGAQALIQGFLAALNNTLAQVNQGMTQNIRTQVQNIPLPESSEYSESSEDEAKRRTNRPYQPPQQVQQYTFSQNFQQPKKEKTVDLKEYYKNFEYDTDNLSNQESANRSGSYAGSIFKMDESYGKKSEGQVNISGIQNIKKSEQISKDIFRDLQQDLSDGEVQPIKSKYK